MKRKFHWIMMLLAVLMLSLCLLPTQAEAAIVNSGTCGENLTWTLDDAGHLTISGTGEMEDYGDAPWGRKIKTVTILNGVTSIGEWAFYNCSRLTSITIPSSVISIGEQAFYHCSILNSVTIPGSVTRIGTYAFAGCVSLTSVTIPSSVTRFGIGAFADCSSLTSITISNGVTTIGGSAFANCSSLTSVTIPSSVTSIGGSAFDNCSSLTSVTISNGVTSIGDRAFANCSSLTSVTIPSSVTSIGAGVFQYSESMEHIYVDPNNRFYYSDSSGIMFNKDKTEILAYPAGRSGAYTIPNSVTSIGESAFSSCDSLICITIPGSVTSIGGFAFYDCDSLTCVTIPSGVTDIGDGAFRFCGSLTEIRFKGEAPYFGIEVFSSVTATAYYPAGKPTWTADVKQNHGGSLTWKIFDPNSIPNVVINKVIAHKTGNILYWNAVDGADIYQIYRLNGSNWELLKNTRSFGYKDETARVGVKHYYKIVARNGDAKSDIKTTVSASAIRPDTKLGNVTIYKTIGHSTGNILYWNAVDGAKLYQVYRLNGTTWELLKNTGSLGYKDETAPKGVACYYKIVARDGDIKSDIKTTTSTRVVRAK